MPMAWFNGGRHPHQQRCLILKRLLAPYWVILNRGLKDGSSALFDITGQGGFTKKCLELGQLRTMCFILELSIPSCCSDIDSW